MDTAPSWNFIFSKLKSLRINHKEFQNLLEELFSLQQNIGKKAFESIDGAELISLIIENSRRVCFENLEMLNKLLLIIQKISPNPSWKEGELENSLNLLISFSYFQNQKELKVKDEIGLFRSISYLIYENSNKLSENFKSILCDLFISILQLRDRNEEEKKETQFAEENLEDLLKLERMAINCTANFYSKIKNHSFLYPKTLFFYNRITLILSDLKSPQLLSEQKVFFSC